jgi:hypothetical protein
MKEFPIAKPTVLIFKETLLPISETFIDAQTRQLSNFVPRYVGLGRVMPSLAIPEDSIAMTGGRSRALATETLPTLRCRSAFSSPRC